MKTVFKGLLALDFWCRVLLLCNFAVYAAGMVISVSSLKESFIDYVMGTSAFILCGCLTAVYIIALYFEGSKQLEPREE